MEKHNTLFHHYIEEFLANSEIPRVHVEKDVFCKGPRVVLLEKEDFSVALDGTMRLRAKKNAEKRWIINYVTVNDGQIDVDTHEYKAVFAEIMQQIILLIPNACWTELMMDVVDGDAFRNHALNEEEHVIKYVSRSNNSDDEVNVYYDSQNNVFMMERYYSIQEGEICFEIDEKKADGFYNAVQWISRERIVRAQRAEIQLKAALARQDKLLETHRNNMWKVSTTKNAEHVVRPYHTKIIPIQKNNKFK